MSKDGSHVPGCMILDSFGASLLHDHITAEVLPAAVTCCGSLDKPEPVCLGKHVERKC